MSSALLFALLASAVAIVYGYILIRLVLRLPEGDDRMKKIARAIQRGASAYLSRQYRTVAIIAVIIFALLWAFLNFKTAIGFVVGAVFSAAAGFIGMNISVRANVRTTEQSIK